MSAPKALSPGQLRTLRKVMEGRVRKLPTSGMRKSLAALENRGLIVLVTDWLGTSDLFPLFVPTVAAGAYVDAVRVRIQLDVNAGVGRQAAAKAKRPSIYVRRPNPKLDEFFAYEAHPVKPGAAVLVLARSTRVEAYRDAAKYVREHGSFFSAESSVVGAGRVGK